MPLFFWKKPTKRKKMSNITRILEEQLLRLVRTGDCEGFKRFAYNESNFHIGVTGSTALRQLKNNIIITTTLCTRAAIDGGLDYDTAYQLSDYFIQSSERLTSADRLTDLLGKVSYTFAEKVAQSKTPISTDERMQKAIRYIQQNVNQHLTVGDVADYVGFSKSYFSAYFKKHLDSLSVHLSYVANWKKAENYCSIQINLSVRSANFCAFPARVIFILHSKTIWDNTVRIQKAAE